MAKKSDKFTLSDFVHHPYDSMFYDTCHIYMKKLCISNILFSKCLRILFYVGRGSRETRRKNIDNSFSPSSVFFSESHVQILTFPTKNSPLFSPIFSKLDIFITCSTLYTKNKINLKKNLIGESLANPYSRYIYEEISEHLYILAGC